MDVVNKESEYSRLSGNSSTPSFHDGCEYVYPSPRRRWPSRHAAAYAFLIILNVASLSLVAKQAYHSHPEDADADCIRPLLTYSPSKEAGAVVYESKTLYRSLNDNPYTGDPRPEHDDAWAKLIEPMTMILSPKEYHKADLGDDTLEMRDGSGYVGEMAVYHELHCIKRIRRHLSLDYYYPNISADDLHREKVHIDHCLEYFREASICRGDTTLATMFWRDSVPTSRVYSKHECVNWEALDAWARTKMIDMDDLEQLVCDLAPELGDLDNQAHRYDLISTTAGQTVANPDVAKEAVSP